MGDRDFLKQGGCVGRQGRSGARSQARTGFIGTYSDARATDPGRQRDCCCSPLGAGGLFWRSDFRCSAFVRTSCGPIVCAHFAGTSIKAHMMCLRTMVSPRGVLTRVQGRCSQNHPQKSTFGYARGRIRNPPSVSFKEIAILGVGNVLESSRCDSSKLFMVFISACTQRAVSWQCSGSGKRFNVMISFLQLIYCRY